MKNKRLKNNLQAAREMAQELKVSAALAEDLFGSQFVSQDTW